MSSGFCSSPCTLTLPVPRWAGREGAESDQARSPCRRATRPVISALRSPVAPGVTRRCSIRELREGGSSAGGRDGLLSVEIGSARAQQRPGQLCGAVMRSGPARPAAWRGPVAQTSTARQPAACAAHVGFGVAHHQQFVRLCRQARAGGQHHGPRGLAQRRLVGAVHGLQVGQQPGGISTARASGVGFVGDATSGRRRLSATSSSAMPG